MAHGTSATVGMVADRYAEAFHDAGLAVLLFTAARLFFRAGLRRYSGASA